MLAKLFLNIYFSVEIDLTCLLFEEGLRRDLSQYIRHLLIERRFVIIGCIQGIRKFRPFP